MSHFYGQITRSARKTMPTARGHKTTGLETRARLLQTLNRKELHKFRGAWFN